MEDPKILQHKGKGDEGTIEVASSSPSKHHFKLQSVPGGCWMGCSACLFVFSSTTEIPTSLKTYSRGKLPSLSQNISLKSKFMSFGAI